MIPVMKFTTNQEFLSRHSNLKQQAEACMHISGNHFQITVFQVMIPCSDVVGYQCFRGPCCLHFQSEVNGTEKEGVATGREYKRG